MKYKKMTVTQEKLALTHIGKHTIHSIGIRTKGPKISVYSEKPLSEELKKQIQEEAGDFEVLFSESPQPRLL